MIPDAAPGIAQAIQLAVAPALLLVAIGGLLNVVAVRLARIVDRAREPERSARGVEIPVEIADGDDALGRWLRDGERSGVRPRRGRGSTCWCRATTRASRWSSR